MPKSSTQRRSGRRQTPSASAAKASASDHVRERGSDPLELSQQVIEIFQSGLAPSTRRTYATPVRSYERFCQETTKRQPYPLEKETTFMWMASLANRSSNPDSKIIQSKRTISVPKPILAKTIKNYAKCVGLHCERQGGTNITSSLPFQTFFNGLKRTLGAPPSKTKFPVGHDTLTRLSHSINITSFDEILCWAALATTTYGLLRKSEITCDRSPRSPAPTPEANQHAIKWSERSSHSKAPNLRKSPCRYNPLRRTSLEVNPTRLISHTSWP